MELRNLKRFMLIGKVLRKHNKTASFEITQKRLALIMCINYMQHHNIKTTRANIHRYFCSIGWSETWLKLLKALTLLISAKLIEKIGSEYKISIECRLLLDKLEKQLKKERLDK